MTTAEKKRKFSNEYPDFLNKIYDSIESQDFRYIDEICNDKRYNGNGYLPKYAKEYVITLLCDELINLTNENENE